MSGILLKAMFTVQSGWSGAPLVNCYKSIFTVQSGGHLSERVTGVRRLLSPIFRTFSPTQVAFFKFFVHFNPILPGGGGGHHPKTAQGIKLKLSDFKDTPLRHILQVKPVC